MPDCFSQPTDQPERHKQEKLEPDLSGILLKIIY